MATETPEYQEPNDMQLPEGKTCGDCRHIHRCTIFGFTPSKEETTCSFAPSRFRLPVAKAAACEGCGLSPALCLCDDERMTGHDDEVTR